MSNNWEKFWLETNSAWGICDSPEQWLERRAAWNKGAHGQKPDEIYNLKLAATKTKRKGDVPSFGSRVEHIGGTKTLGEFFDEHNMDRNIGDKTYRRPTDIADFMWGLGYPLDAKDLELASTVLLNEVKAATRSLSGQADLLKHRYDMRIRGQVASLTVNMVMLMTAVTLSGMGHTLWAVCAILGMLVPPILRKAYYRKRAKQTETQPK